ncbi:MAG: murein biosynthesis integral membrane protein MurJ, partial [Chloroflexota bacterium]
MTQRDIAPPPPDDGQPRFAPNARAADAEAATRQEDSDREGVAKATGIVAAGNIASRVLGLAREIVLTNLFGASVSLAAFENAVILPKAFYDLLIGGHVNSALVPVLSKAAAEDAPRDFWDLVSVVFSFVITIMTILATGLWLLAPWIVPLLAGENTAIIAPTTSLLRLILPALVFLSLFAVLSGTLYALRRFSFPAFAGALFNASIVIVTLALAPVIGIRAAAFGWLIGSVAQFALQLPGLRDSRLRMSFRWNHPGLLRIGLLYIPVSFSLIIDTLVVRFFSYRLANDILETGVVYMNRATTLIQLPQGLVATAISIAILPTLSQQAANLLKPDGDAQPFKNTLGMGLRLATMLILPATVGLFVLATPIVALLFEHGQFTAADTTITVSALRLYLIGLPFAAIDLLLVYAFYARQDTLTPALIGVVSLMVYMAVALATSSRFGLYSLMIADSVKHLLHAFISSYILLRRLDGAGNQRLILTTLKASAAAALMGATAFALLRFMGTSASGSLAEAGFVLVSGSISGL